MNEPPISKVNRRYAVDRATRLPLSVQVLTEPVMHDCWSVDISRTGIGLVAARPAERTSPCPGEGEEIELELALPDSGSRIRPRGEIRWQHEARGYLGGQLGLALGLRFTWMSGADRAVLSRYLQDYRFHVGVAFASGDARSRITEALGEHTHLHFADSPGALGEVAGRGDIAAIVACTDDAARLAAVIEHTHRARPGSGWNDLVVPRDLAPRTVHLGRVPPEVLLRHFNAGRIFLALAPPVAPAELRRAVLHACSDYGMRTEQRRLAQALERALLQERARTRSEAVLRRVVADRMIHQSEAMARVVDLVRTVAPHRMVVLLQGETGTGKEILAQTLHELSDRANASFVVQDCGALPENLLESELFGHVKGAFTGATAEHPGLFQLSDGGTVFLDEIENTTAKLQTRLLRVLETGSVRPVGSARVRHVDVRVVAASNRDLRAEVAAGRFRADLFYRLSSFIIDVPALRQRPGDIQPLAHHFLERANAAFGGRATGFTAEAEAALLAHPWPGNVRELRNVVERAVLLSRPGAPVGPAQLPPGIGAGPPAPDAGTGGLLRTQVAETERRAIRAALGRHGGVVRRAARELGVSPATLGRKLRALGIDPKGC